MNKKLLLSTALASVLTFSSVVNAADNTIRLEVNLETNNITLIYPNNNTVTNFPNNNTGIANIEAKLKADLNSGTLQGTDPLQITASQGASKSTNKDRLITINQAQQKSFLEGKIHNLSRNARVQAIKNSGASSDIINEQLGDFRDSGETEDIFADRLSDINELLSSDNEQDKLNGQAQLNDLVANIDAYLATAPQNLDLDDLSDVQKPDTAASEGMMNSLLATRGVIDSRMAGFAGTAAGDLGQSYGAWIQGVFGQGTQKTYKKTTGYKTDYKGVTIGADTGEETLLGAAYSYFMNDVKSKANSANKEDIKSHIFTVYGKHDLSNEVFLSGQGQFGKSNIKKKRDSGGTAHHIVTAKTDAALIAAKLEVGYVYEAGSNIHLVPSIGASYADIKVDGYKETGSGLKREIAKRTTNRTSGLAGISARYIADTGSMKLIPEMHANIDYAFSTKNSSTSVKVFEGVASVGPIATPSDKPVKAYYNLGASVRAVQSSMYEISAGYDLGLAKKFQSHTGTLKLRVNM